MIKKTNLLISLILLVTIGVNAQTYLVQARPVMNDSWGYADLRGEMVIQPQFKMCYEFSNDGVALVYFSKKNSYKIVKTNGEILELEDPNNL